MTFDHDVCPENRVRKPIIDELGKFAVGKMDVRKFPAHNALQRFMCEDTSAEQRDEIADKIYRNYIRGFSFKHKVIHTALLSSIAGVIKNRIYKERSGEVFIQTEFVRKLIGRILNNADIGQSDYAMITELFLKVSDRDGLHCFEGMPIAEFRECAEHVIRSKALIETIEKGLAEQRESDSSNNKEEFRQMSDELFDSLMKSWQYTIRQSFWEDPFFHKTDEAWVVLDHRQFKEFPSDLREKFAHIVAYFFVASDKTYLSQVNASTRSYEVEGCKRVTLKIPFDYNRVVRLCSDGDLYLTTLDAPISLRAICQKTGREEAYEFLRLMLIGRLFDLVVPRRIVEQTPSMPPVRTLLTNARKDGKSLLESIRDIIVPRTMVIKNPEEVSRAYQEEKGEIQNKPKQTHRFLGRVGHPMTLREGYHAHPDANKWAHEDGFWRDLTENETWVRPINRDDSFQEIVYRQKGI